MNKTLFCDMDGVVANFSKEFSRILSDLTGGPIITDKEEVKGWNWETWYPNATKKLVSAAWETVRNTKNFWEGLECKDTQALVTLWDMRDFYDIYFVTSRTSTKGASVMRQTQFWLNANGFFTNPNVITSKEKNLIASILGANIMIDDKFDYFLPENVAINKDNWDSLYIIDYPHNRKQGLDPSVKRVASLAEALKELKN